MLLEIGSAVREFFLHDLMLFNSCKVFLPEWICFEMSQKALLVTNLCFWYPVDSYEKSQIPLQTNWKKLKEMIKKVNPSLKNPVIVLLAHPMGFIDPGMLSFLKAFKKDEGIYFYLDCAQSYGRYDFSHYLNYVKALYISFNGNKLLSCGGAIRISTYGNNNPKLSNERYLKLKEEIKKAVHRQALNWIGMLNDLKTTYSINDLCLNSYMKRFDIPYLRSNRHRTVFEISKSDLLFEEFQKKGFGQTIHKDPQNGLIKTSKSYKSWEDAVLLLFSKRRKENEK